MTRQVHTRKCQHCKTFFIPDPRCGTRQRYCSKSACRQASKAASQQRWLQQPANRAYFTGPTHVERVRAWRQAHPGYWRRQRSKSSHALQDEFTPQPAVDQSLNTDVTQDALQDELFRQPTVLVGLISHLTGLALQDDIVSTTRRLQQLGRDMLTGSSLAPGGSPHAQTSHLAGPAPAHSASVQLGGSALGP